MDQALNALLALITGLIGVVMTVIGVIESHLRHAMAQAGINGPAQSAVLVIAAVLLVLGAWRLFGGLLTWLVALFLLLLVVHIVVPGLGQPG